jgi:hypothetical protein
MGPHHSPSALSAALSASETVTRNARPNTMPKVRRRDLRKIHMPLRLSFSFCASGTRQMVSSAVCSCPNTVDAPKSSRPMLKAAAKPPVFGSLTWASISWIASAPFWPMSDETWVNTMPRTASGPKTRPAMLMMRNRSGAMENIE